MSERRLQALLKEIRGCEICAAELPLGPRPVLRAIEHVIMWIFLGLGIVILLVLAGVIPPPLAQNRIVSPGLGPWPCSIASSNAMMTQGEPV